MIGALNTRSQKCYVGVKKGASGTPVSEDIADIFLYYIEDGGIVVSILAVKHISLTGAECLHSKYEWVRIQIRSQ